MSNGVGNGITLERALVAALFEFFSLETSPSWDNKYGIDVVIRGFKDPPLVRTPLAVQITWRRGSWDKRSTTYEKAKRIAERIVFLEIDSDGVYDLVILGVRTALASLIMETGSPTHTIVEVGPDGRYKISDMEVRLKDFKMRLGEIIPGDIVGRLTYWNLDFGFVEATLGDETFTFFCGKKNTSPAILGRFNGYVGQISDPPTVVLNDGGVNYNAEYRKFALNVRFPV